MTPKISEWLISGLIGAFIALPISILFMDVMNDMIVPVFGGTVARRKRRFHGIWDATYTRLDRPDEPGVSEKIVLKQIGSRVIGKRVNENKVRLRGKIQHEIYLTGEWHDTGDRASYHGAFQFMLEVGKGKEMIGRWVGFSSNRFNIRHGEWRLRIIK